MQSNTNPTTSTAADVICRTHELGLAITHAVATNTRTLIHATPITPTTTCPDCGHPGTKRDHTTRRLVDLPIALYPTMLHIRLPRYVCTNPDCGRTIFTSHLDYAVPKARVATWILLHLADAHTSIAAIARTLRVG